MFGFMRYTEPHNAVFTTGLTANTRNYKFFSYVFQLVVLLEIRFLHSLSPLCCKDTAFYLNSVSAFILCQLQLA